MKVLIQDCSSNLYSESLTLYTALKYLGVNVKLWNKSAESAYDAFDTFRPDAFITKYDNITHDIFSRISEEDKLISIIRCKDKEEERKAAGIVKNCKTFSGVAQPCNIFMSNLVSSNLIKIEYNIDSLYVISKDDDLKKLIVRPAGSYHIISINPCDKADIVMSIGSIYSIAKNYKKVHILIDNCEHVAMDFCILGNETFYNGMLFPAVAVKSHTAYDLLCNIFNFDENTKNRISEIKREKIVDNFPKNGILEIPKGM
jgi:hypothetical protein